MKQQKKQTKKMNLMILFIIEQFWLK